MFRDITTLLKNPMGLRMVVDGLAEHFAQQKIDKIAGIEARGFIIGAALACKLGVGFVPIRKAGKLPAETISKSYQLEYGTDSMEVHTDAITQGERVLLVDDLIATGGTAEAGVALIEKLGGEVAACAFVIDLPDLGGTKRLQEKGLQVFSLCEFEGH
jgi:adenine phosphoribosyltransferase